MSYWYLGAVCVAVILAGVYTFLCSLLAPRTYNRNPFKIWIIGFLVSLIPTAGGITVWWLLAKFVVTVLRSVGVHV